MSEIAAIFTSANWQKMGFTATFARHGRHHDGVLSCFARFRAKDSCGLADELHMTDGKPRKPADPLYQLLREGRGEEFNRRRKAGEKCDLRGSDLRGLDLRELDVTDVDFSDCYFRQT